MGAKGIAPRAKIAKPIWQGVRLQAERLAAFLLPSNYCSGGQSEEKSKQICQPTTYIGELRTIMNPIKMQDYMQQIKLVKNWAEGDNKTEGCLWAI